jgi:4-amino-4-deoxy-L-arabinose transferase-like glycosyltransferase
MSRPVFWLAATAILGLALWWRLESLDRRPLWLDETSTEAVVRESPTFGALWSHGARDEFLHPPLAYLGNWIATRGGITPERLRLPSVAEGLASIALAIALGTRLFGRGAGLLTGFLLAISFHHVDYSQEARPYMASVALTLAMYLALFAWTDRRRPAALAAFVACAALALYTYHLALLHVGVAAGVVAWDTVAAARRDGARAALRRAAPFGIAGAALALLYLPQLANLRGFLAGSGAAPNHVLDLGPRVLHAVADRWVSGPAWATGLCEVAFALGALRLARRRDAIAAGVAAWLAAPFLLFGLVPFSKYFDLRFLISAVPAFFLVVAAGIDAAARAAPSPRLRAAAALACAAVLFVPAARLHPVYRDAAQRCGDIVRDPAIFTASDRLCADHLMLNTIRAEHQWVLRKVGRWIELPPALLDVYAGRYRFADGRAIDLRRDGDHLVAQIEGRYAFALVAESETRLPFRVDHRVITIERGPDGRPAALVLSGGGPGSRAVREAEASSSGDETP